MRAATCVGRSVGASFTTIAGATPERRKRWRGH
jgi:hypothetical protein